MSHGLGVGLLANALTQSDGFSASIACTDGTSVVYRFEDRPHERRGVDVTLERSNLVMTSLAGDFDEWAELAAVLKAHVGDQTARFRLIVPASPGVGGREVALRHVSGAIAGLADAGLTADGCVGDSDPMIAVQEAWDPSLYDEIIISSLPTGLSRWLHAAFPERVVKLTGPPVTHHVWEPTKPRHEAESGTLADHQPLLPRSPLVPLAVLQWGRRPSPSRDA